MGSNRLAMAGRAVRRSIEAVQRVREKEIATADTELAKAIEVSPAWWVKDELLPLIRGSAR